MYMRLLKMANAYDTGTIKPAIVIQLRFIQKRPN